MKRKTNYTGTGIGLGFLLGLILDIYFAVSSNVTCELTKIQEFFGITPLCVKIYFLTFWLAIIGGIIGYFIKRK